MVPSRLEPFISSFFLRAFVKRLTFAASIFETTSRLALQEYMVVYNREKNAEYARRTVWD